jgi:hypothetical protein
METLLEFIKDRITSDKADQVYNELVTHLEDHQDDPIDLRRMKEFIVWSSPWPEFIDPGSSFMLNNADRLVDNGLAIELMQALAEAGYGTYRTQATQPRHVFTFQRQAA